jgi:hypothetical protein
MMMSIENDQVSIGRIYESLEYPFVPLYNVTSLSDVGYS